MRIAIPLALACLAGGATGLADQSGRRVRTGPVRFEAVSIKPCGNALNRGGVKTSPVTLRAECVTVDELVRRAVGLVVPNVFTHEAAVPTKGGPPWVRSRRFTIDAKTAMPSTEAEMTGPMMRDVLEQRFKLRTHEETQSLAVYDLTLAPGGAKLQPAKGGCFQLAPGKTPPGTSKGQPPPPTCGGFRASPKGGIDSFGITMSFLCRQLSALMERDVIDKTGLQGVYDLHLETTLQDFFLWKRMSSGVAQEADSAIPEAGDPGGSIISAVRKLGLQLKPGTKRARLIAIDHVEMPGEN